MRSVDSICLVETDKVVKEVWSKVRKCFRSDLDICFNSASPLRSFWENNNTTQQFIQKLAEREKVSPQKIEEIIINSLRQSYCKGENSQADLHFEFTNGLVVYRCYKIVEKITNPAQEIVASDNLLAQGKSENGIFFLPLDIKNFSFSLNQEIKKQLNQNLGEFQQGKQYELFKNRQGEIIKGKIQSLADNNYCLVNLGQGVGQ
ncbi:2896_t:CDS:2 [Entrophospora sp. SA101]|nr:12373_t:CDS:2 [Entrophospora sp. SA101]CAJ0837686.1 2896_t:CDS:2 [Entrophospora sp. SA101]